MKENDANPAWMQMMKERQEAFKGFANNMIEFWTSVIRRELIWQQSNS